MSAEPLNNKPRFCPACEESFVPWGAWKISRWTGIKCPFCSAPLTRSYDVQFWRLVLLIVLVVPFLVTSFSFLGISSVGAFLTSVIPLYILDVFTIRLQVAREFGGIRGYKM